MSLPASKSAKGFFIALFIALLIQPTPTIADEHFSEIATQWPQQSSRLYRSPRERREAGRQREITEWLQISGLVEFEDSEKKDIFVDKAISRENESPVLTLQLGLEFEISQWLNAEITLESERDRMRNHTGLDEAFLSAELGEWGLELGRQSLPFGEYYSHFVEGPILEFGETTTDFLVVDYTFNDVIELAGFIFESEIDSPAGSDGFDWGARIEYTSPTEAIKIGLSYLSDLTESDEGLLEEHNNQFDRRIAAWNAYTSFELGKFRLTAETLRADKGFTGLDSNVNKPSSSNIEIAYFATKALLIGGRIERSDEVEDLPHKRYGITISWSPKSYFQVSADVLFGKFRDSFSFDDNEKELERDRQFAIQLAMEF